MMRFICGCDIPPNILNRESLKTMDTVKVDSAGFIVCAVHHERRYGWRSVPYTSKGTFGTPVLPNWTELEYEAWVLYNEIPFPLNSEVKSSYDDIRDNRDPQVMGNEILAAHNGG